MPDPELTDEDRALYEWQMWLPGVGEEGQRRIKSASVLISRVGGIGGLVAMQLAAAGVGRLVLAHAGPLRASDLNRQLLQTRSQIGLPRMESILRRLRDLNPDVVLEGHEENVTPANAERLIAGVDFVVDAAPLFEERLAMNDAAMRLRRPMVECAMFGMEASVTTFIPGQTGCLRCYVPEVPLSWKRQFPVLGAVSGSAACIGAVEILKLMTGVGEPLAGRLLNLDLATGRAREVRLPRRADCPACGEKAT